MNHSELFLSRICDKEKIEILSGLVHVDTEWRYDQFSHVEIFEVGMKGFEMDDGVGAIKTAGLEQVVDDNGEQEILNCSVHVIERLQS